MRILFILHQFFPEFGGGTERVALNLARMAQRAGHHVHVLAGTVDPALCGGTVVDAPVAGCLRATREGLPVTFIPRSLLPATADIGFGVDNALADRLAAWMDAERFDVAHVLHTMRMSSAVLAAQRCGLPYMVTLTDFFLPCSQIYLVTTKQQLCAGPEGGDKCARDCSVPPWTADAFHGRYEQSKSILEAAAERVVPSGYVARGFQAAYPGLPVRVVPHGLDMVSLSGGANHPARTWDGELRLAYAGAILHQKGLHVLLQALALLPGRRLSLRAMGGFWGDTGYHQEIRAMAKADPRVQLTGELPAREVFAQLSQSDLFCLPSLMPEPFSLVHIESAAAGIPALVSNRGAPADRVAKSKAGIAVDAESPQAWAQAIASVLDRPGLLQEWRRGLELPFRVEEEAFFYESLWRRIRRNAS